MKALPTQFDNSRLSSAVATPTCSSCCCCCCCLATSIASSTLLAQRIAKEGEKHQVFNRHMLTVIAALFVPVVGVLVYFGSWTINLLLRTCSSSTYEFSGTLGSQHYTVCTSPGAAGVLPLLIIMPFLVLLYLYARVHIAKPVQRAALVTALIAIAFTAEFFGGAFMILTGIGGIGYLILVPVIVGWITVWYKRHLSQEPDEQLMEQHGQDPAKPEEPSQPNPPAAIPQ
jgi:hypothetical protein